MIKTVGGTRYGSCNTIDRKCALCGKRFLATRLHVYKINNKYYCNWSCYRAESNKGASVNKTDINCAALQELLFQANGIALNLILVFAEGLLDKEKTASACNTDDLGV